MPKTYSYKLSSGGMILSKMECIYDEYEIILEKCQREPNKVQQHDEAVKLENGIAE